MKKLSNVRFLGIVFAFVAVLGLHGFSIVHAATDPNACYSDSALNLVKSAFPAQYCSASGVIPLVINILLGFLGIISVLFIIIGGYRMVVSSGNEESFAKGRQTVLYAVIGLLVAIFAYAIVSIVGNSVTSFSNSPQTPATTSTAPNQNRCADGTYPSVLGTCDDNSSPTPVTNNP